MKNKKDSKKERILIRIDIYKGIFSIKPVDTMYELVKK